jgi:hypothetical protein
LQDLYRGLGWSCYRKGALSEAAEHFESAIRVLGAASPELAADARRGLQLAEAGSQISDEPQTPCVVAPPAVSVTTAQKTRSSSVRSALRGGVAALIRPLKRRLRF